MLKNYFGNADDYEAGFIHLGENSLTVGVKILAGWESRSMAATYQRKLQFRSERQLLRRYQSTIT